MAWFFIEFIGVNQNQFANLKSGSQSIFLLGTEVIECLQGGSAELGKFFGKFVQNYTMEFVIKNLRFLKY